MIIVHARTSPQLSDDELGRLLADAYARLREYENDADNLPARITDLQPAITEAVRRLRRSHVPIGA
jgi:hypothetical protein